MEQGNADAVTVAVPERDRAAPVVFSSPHSGRAYPSDFRPAVPPERLVGFEDRFVDDLLAGAPSFGVPLLAATFPRAYIDPNRAPDDLDRTMVDASWTDILAPSDHGRRGIGLIFGRLQDGKAIYDRPLTRAEVHARLQFYWRPFHDALDRALDAAAERWGAVWHIDWHSMRPIGDALSPDPGRGRPDFVVSDRDGTSAEPGFTEHVAAALRGLGHTVDINHPFKGGYIVQRFGRPDAGRHSLQVEINRALYLDAETLERGPGFAGLRATLDRLVPVIARYALDRVRQA